MLESVRLRNFKSFRDATLPLGPFTVIVGTNASGKSNLRDAFRFLHGIGRGYTLAEIIGEKYGDGGERVWRGIRGGVREIAFNGALEFELAVDIVSSRLFHKPCHSIRVRMPAEKAMLTVLKEQLSDGDKIIFGAELKHSRETCFQLNCTFWDSDEERTKAFPADKPVLSQIRPLAMSPDSYLGMAVQTAEHLSSIRFLDFSPDELCRPSLPGQTSLGDAGENLSSVLHRICKDADASRAITGWLQELTPLDVVDLEFEPDYQGRLSLILVESSGKRTSAYSASEGTLRFLGLLAALMGPNPPAVIFLEELDTGIHPARLRLLVELIEHHTSQNKVQVIATTHSPSLLAMLGERARDDALLVSRLSGENESRIQRIVDIPHAREVLQEENLSRLHESGWLEDAVAFAQAETGT